MFDAFWELDALPVDEVKAALAGWVGPLPELDALDDAVRTVHGLPLRPLRLRTVSVARDADVLDLGPVAEEQLRIAGTTWDGVDLTAEERLDGEIEGSFAGSLERRVLVDADAGDVPRFDVILLGDGAGVVFAAGTAKVVALIAYGRVETTDARVRVAIEAALAETVIAAPAVEEPAPASGVTEVPRAEPATEPEAPAHVESVAEVAVVAAPEPAPIATVDEPKPVPPPVKKKSVAKRPATKKAAVAKKPAAKKETPAKKAPAKKIAAKKIAAKKASSKTKAATTKAAAKKTPARKVAAKKAVAKKKTATKTKR